MTSALRIGLAALVAITLSAQVAVAQNVSRRVARPATRLVNSRTSTRASGRGLVLHAE
jgi:hypothetical protein